MTLVHTQFSGVCKAEQDLWRRVGISSVSYSPLHLAASNSSLESALGFARYRAQGLRAVKGRGSLT